MSWIINFTRSFACRLINEILIFICDILEAESPLPRCNLSVHFSSLFNLICINFSFVDSRAKDCDGDSLKRWTLFLLKNKFLLYLGCCLSRWKNAPRFSSLVWFRLLIFIYFYLFFSVKSFYKLRWEYHDIDESLFFQCKFQVEFLCG